MKLRSDTFIFTLLLGGFAAYKWMEICYSPPTLLRAYWEDLLAVPLLLQTALWATHALFPAYRGFVLGKYQGFLFLTAFSVYFELILPLIDQRFTRDPADVLCYILGFCIFFKWMNKRSLKRLSPFKTQGEF